MNKQEFEEKIGKEISDSDYQAIEIVYMWHPSISNSNGKQQIADIYAIGGMTIIMDMLWRAERAFEIGQKIAKLESDLNAWKQDYNDLTY
jgi:hypothetical protein